MNKISDRQNKIISDINTALEYYLPALHESYNHLNDALLYSLVNGGKRIRPLLLLEFSALCGTENPQIHIPFACALEMIHTYSLIHDDLPCMDNDDYRRGKLTNHKVFGESTALLAGDALLTKAFEIMLDDKNGIDINPVNRLHASKILADAAGINGMIGGQYIDLSSENKLIDLETLELMDKLKTGALIKAACEMGCILSNATDQEIIAARNFAQDIGLTFQIVDDVLDVTGDSNELGKSTGSDAENQKSTYVSLLGLDESIALANELTERAISNLDVFTKNPTVKSDLINLALLLAKRKK